MTGPAAGVAAGQVPARRAGVLGKPIRHSLSPALHRAAYTGLGLTGWSYDRFEVGEDELAGFLDGLDATWAGLSLTMPLKRIVFGLADEVSATAAATHAANTLIFDTSRTGAGGRIHRRIDNTDVAGIVNALNRGGPARGGLTTGGAGRAVVLGGGATAASAVAALQRLGWREVTLCVRSPVRAGDVLATAGRLGVQVAPAYLDEAAALVANAAVVVSTVPGDVLAPLAATLSLVDSPATGMPVLLDVVYDPWPTRLAAAWQEQNGRVVSGLDMLIFQAVDQVQMMTGLMPDARLMEVAVRPPAKMV